MTAPDNSPRDRVVPENAEASPPREIRSVGKEASDPSRGAGACDPGICPEGYEFLIRALAYTQISLRRDGHVSGRELLGGFRELALHEFGPLARTVLEYWGVRSTGDVGAMVRYLVESGQWSRRREDQWDEFQDGFDFQRVFDEEYPWNVRKALGLECDAPEA